MWRGGIKGGIIKPGALINTGRAERKNEANDLNNYKHIRIFVLPFFQALYQTIVILLYFIALSVTNLPLVETI